MSKFFLFFLCFTCTVSYAQNISGLYSGTIYNDTTKQTQAYELAISEYRGKISGYAYATFVANDTFYYSIRKVKAEKKDQQLLVEDAEMLANNFPVKPDKGVRRITAIPLNHLSEKDTLSFFHGNWKTTRTKEFYSVPGTMDLKRTSDSNHSALVAHLTEMRLINAGNPITPVTASATLKEKENDSQKATSEKSNSRTNELKEVATAVLPYTQRQQQLLQTIDIKSDSVLLTFYDNGVVDGDVISVNINNQNIISNSKLLAVATRKNVVIGTGEATLILVAENLGAIPPNTGLLVVQDSEKKYEIRFTADLQTNAAVVFRKTK